MQNLIPDVSEDIGIECLIRIHHKALPAAQRVCKRWRQLVESPFFHRLRLSANSTRRLIILSQINLTAKDAITQLCIPSFQIAIVDLAIAKWSTLPPIPCLPRSFPHFHGLVTSGHNLIVIGAWDPDVWLSSNTVYVFNFVAGTWRCGCPMPGPRRTNFACAASHMGHVFVVGGHDMENKALKSGMAYDIDKDKWYALPDMARNRDQCSSVFDVKSRQLRVVGGYDASIFRNFEKNAEAFDVAEWRWREVKDEAVEEKWTSECIMNVDERM